jgi:hypothetical protein
VHCDGNSSVSQGNEYEESCLLGRCAVLVWQKLTDVSDMLTTSIIGAIVHKTAIFVHYLAHSNSLRDSVEQLNSDHTFTFDYTGVSQVVCSFTD